MRGICISITKEDEDTINDLVQDAFIPNRSLEIFPCKKLEYSKLYSCYSLFMLT